MPGMHRPGVGDKCAAKDMPRNSPSELPKHGRFRTAVQLATAALTNGYVMGFAKGTLYTGAGKAVCVPWLNCYSCPGALGSCPVGALQTVLGSSTHKVSFYVMGLLVLVGTLVGRLVCGFCCPFGLVQDLLHRIPTPKFELPRRLDRALRMLKYVVALVLVVGLPMLVRALDGSAPPFFCKLLCPAGTLEGALPLLVTNPQLRSLVGFLFSWKFLVLVVVLVAAVLLRRPFCRYLCPLGAFYGLFNRVSLYQMRCETSRCVSCHRCASVCPMGLDPEREMGSAECIRCGACKAACPATAITSSFELLVREQIASDEGR